MAFDRLDDGARGAWWVTDRNNAPNIAPKPLKFGVDIVEFSLRYFVRWNFLGSIRRHKGGSLEILQKMSRFLLLTDESKD